jgi:hypothetical protein
MDRFTIMAPPPLDRTCVRGKIPADSEMADESHHLRRLSSHSRGRFLAVAGVRLPPVGGLGRLLELGVGRLPSVSRWAKTDSQLGGRHHGRACSPTTSTSCGSMRPTRSSAQLSAAMVIPNTPSRGTGSPPRGRLSRIGTDHPRQCAGPWVPSDRGRVALPRSAGRKDNPVRKQQKPELTEVPLDDPPEELQPSEMG